MTPLQLRNHILKTDFPSFINKTFSTINYGQEYKHNWHIDTIAYHLEKIYNGEIKRLIITIPPRYLKSICVSVAFPAFVIGNKPYSRIIVASYSDILATKHSTDCRSIMTSQWFKSVFPDCEIIKGQNEKTKFSTTKNGFRFATSVGGSLTGEGGDILIIDDPHNPQQVMNEKYRAKTIEWFGNTFISRLNDKKRGAIVIVMQRLHQDDLVGNLTSKEHDWTILNIPAIADKDYIYKNYTYKQNEILHNDRESLTEINKIKKDMGSYIFSAQYLQNPFIKGDGIIKAEWMKYYEELNGGLVYLSFDTAIKTGVNNDPTVCTIWKEYDEKLYLMDVIRKWLDYPDLKKTTINLIEKWNPEAILIEDKASGQSLIQDLKGVIGIIAIKVSKDKITRLASVSPLFESGIVYLPKNADWLVEYENELYNFPAGNHDDQVDSTSQFLGWWKDRGKNKGRIRIRRIN